MGSWARALGAAPKDCHASAAPSELKARRRQVNADSLPCAQVRKDWKGVEDLDFFIGDEAHNNHGVNLRNSVVIGIYC